MAVCLLLSVLPIFCLLQLMEAHEGALRGLVLTADGSKLATASVKGTVIRVWDVATATCLQEFRRGVDRATITCLAWSWDDQWLSCTSDKGTAHIFQMQDKNKEDGNADGSSAHATSDHSTSTSLTSYFFSSVRKSVEGDTKKSVCQVRGVPHPQACAFVADANQLLAVAGWDADGNGVLLLAEFTPHQEPRRVGYHVLCKSPSVAPDETEEAKRRRRLRGWTPEIPQTPEGGRLYVGERLEILEQAMYQIQFEEKDEFVSVTAIRRPETDNTNTTAAASNKKEEEQGSSEEVGSSADENRSSSQLDSTVGDSVRTEPLDDEGC